jgi:hypothetical protein
MMQPALATPTVSGPVIALNWTSVSGATSYEVQQGADSNFTTLTSGTVAGTSTALVVDIGSYALRRTRL